LYCIVTVGLVSCAVSHSGLTLSLLSLLNRIHASLTPSW